MKNILILFSIFTDLGLKACRDDHFLFSKAFLVRSGTIEETNQYSFDTIFYLSYYLRSDYKIKYFHENNFTEVYFTVPSVINNRRVIFNCTMYNTKFN